MKYLFFIFLLAGSATYAQYSTSFYQKIIKKGFCEENTVSCVNKQYAYFDACDKLGDYFFKKKKYRKASRYYKLPLKIDSHAFSIFTDSAYTLRNNIIAKAGDMIFNGTSGKKDTGEAYKYHFQFPLNLTKEQRHYYSNLYFGTVKDTFIIPIPETLSNVSMLVSINPFMLTDENTLQKIALSIIGKAGNDKKIDITIYKGQLLSIDEDMQGIMYKSIEMLQNLLLLLNTSLKIDSGLDISDDIFYGRLNGKAAPTYIIEINP